LDGRKFANFTTIVCAGFHDLLTLILIWTIYFKNIFKVYVTLSLFQHIIQY